MNVRCAEWGRRHSVLDWSNLAVVRWIFAKSGNNSVVECDLAKVEVAGSNPVSRSNLRSREPQRELRLAGHAKVARRSAQREGWASTVPPAQSDRRRRQVVRQRSAKPPSPVQIRT